MGGVAVEEGRLIGRVFGFEEKIGKEQTLNKVGHFAGWDGEGIWKSLVVVRLLFDSLKLEEQEDEHKGKDLLVIREKLNHLEQIAGRILEFGKSRESFRKNVRVREILEDAAVYHLKALEKPVRFVSSKFTRNG